MAGPPTVLEVEVSGDEEDGVAELLGVEALQGEVRVIAVQRILDVLLGRLLAALLIDRREHDHALQLLERHTVLLELRRQILEQCGIGWWIADGAEVVGGVDDAGAEVPLPDAVDPDAGGERAGDDVVGELKPAAALGVGLLVGGA